MIGLDDIIVLKDILIRKAFNQVLTSDLTCILSVTENLRLCILCMVRKLTVMTPGPAAGSDGNSICKYRHCSFNLLLKQQNLHYLTVYYWHRL